jgi:hypothetical protein
MSPKLNGYGTPCRGLKYMLVDQTSIHRELPPPPARPLHLRPPNTTVDIKIDGRTAGENPQMHLRLKPKIDES